MTESDWLGCIDPEPMLKFLRSRVKDRRIRLFAVACCRRQWHELEDERSRTAVEMAEQYADRGVSKKQCATAYIAALAAATNPDRTVKALAFAAALAARPRFDPSGLADCVACSLVGENATRYEKANQADLLRDIFGLLNFRTINLGPTWLTWNHATVPAIARHVYDDRAFHDLPILADALEDAGCTNAELLDHCRGPGPHVRGCWAVDLLLGKVEATAR